jgi:Skp family chaperone for outer membrane proteins
MYLRRTSVRTSASALAIGLTLSLFAPGGVTAQSAPKIAVVDLERVFIDSKLGKELQTAIRGLEDATRKKIEEIAKRAQDLEAQYEAATTEEQRRDAVRRREDAELEARRVRDDAQREATSMEQKKQVEFNETMGPLFEKLQTERGFDLILNKVQGVVIYAGATIDITPTVLELMANQ